MGVSFDVSGNFDRTVKWLTDSKDERKVRAVMEELGKEGAEALSRRTPRIDSGETAASWTYTIDKTRDGLELNFVNTAHPYLTVNLAKLMHTGYATGTGGYVPPIRYIKTAMDRLMSDAGRRFLEGVIE